MGGLGWGSKNDPPLFWAEDHESFVFCFFDFEAKKCFRVPTPRGLYGAECDKRSCNLCTFQPFLLCWRFWRPR